MIHIVGLCALYVGGYGLWWSLNIYPRHAGIVLLVVGIALMTIYLGAIS